MSRSFIEESQAGIKISPQDNNYYGLNDRLVTVTGTLDEQMRAIDLILSKLAEDPHYSQSMNAPFSYPGVPSFISLSINDSVFSLAAHSFHMLLVLFMFLFLFFNLLGSYGLSNALEF